MLDPNGPSGRALASLTPEQLAFLQGLPKAELHAHLNGCIPLACLQTLACDVISGDTNNSLAAEIRESLSMLSSGVNLDEISDFFNLFPAIYAITSTPAALRTATVAVLDSFLARSADGQPPDCSYLELRTTPRATPHMTRREYLLAVLAEVSLREQAALIVSTDRRMDVETASECVELAIDLRNGGYPVVGSSGNSVAVD